MLNKCVPRIIEYNRIQYGLCGPLRQILATMLARLIDEKMQRKSKAKSSKWVTYIFLLWNSLIAYPNLMSYPNNRGKPTSSCTQSWEILCHITEPHGDIVRLLEVCMSCSWTVLQYTLGHDDYSQSNYLQYMLNKCKKKLVLSRKC